MIPAEVGMIDRLCERTSRAASWKVRSGAFLSDALRSTTSATSTAFSA
jgi:hypothetical protein